LMPVAIALSLPNRRKALQPGRPAPVITFRPGFEALNRRRISRW
jgi:hypothetical protein